MKAGDVLADHVKLGWPSAGEIRIGEASRGQIIGERVEPDIRGLRLPISRGTWERDAPREACTTGRDVLEATLDQREDLVAAAFRSQEVRMLGEMRAEEVGVPTEPEEPVPLLDPLERASGVQHAVPLGDLLLCLERFTPHAIPARIGLLVEILG